MRSRGGVMAVLLLAMACRLEPGGSPEAAYRRFSEALQKGQTQTAWTMLSKASRDKASQRSRAISEASHHLVRDEPTELFFQGHRAEPLGELAVVKADETSALIQVVSEQGRSDIKMVKEAGKWFIDLSDSIESRNLP